jgi:hypothetical protein
MADIAERDRPQSLRELYPSPKGLADVGFQ